MKKWYHNSETHEKRQFESPPGGNWEPGMGQKQKTVHCHNPKTGEGKRFPADAIPDGWTRGMGNSGKSLYHNPVTGEVRKFFQQDVPDGWVKGGIPGRRWFHNPETGEQRLFDENSLPTLPWVRGSLTRWYHNPRTGEQYFGKEPPDGWVLGKSTVWYHNPETGSQGQFCENKAPAGWVKGRGHLWYNPDTGQHIFAASSPGDKWKQSHSSLGSKWFFDPETSTRQRVTEGSHEDHWVRGMQKENLVLAVDSVGKSQFFLSKSDIPEGWTDKFIWCHNDSTGERRRFPQDAVPDGWSKGMGLETTCWYHHPETFERGKYVEAPADWVEGQGTPKRVWAYNSDISERKQVDPDEVPGGWELGRGGTWCYDPKTLEQRLLFEVPEGWVEGFAASKVLVKVEGKHELMSLAEAIESNSNIVKMPETKKMISLPQKKLRDTIYEHCGEAFYFTDPFDLVSADHPLAIEFNGTWYHKTSKVSAGKPADYHFKKREQAEEQGLRLIHVDEHLWNDPRCQPIFLSNIAAACGKTRKVFARKCEFREIDGRTARLFMEKNHMQGHTRAARKFALFFEDEMVMVMTFRNPISKNYGVETEIARAASVLGTTVVGGSSKLLKNAMREMGIKSVLSYCDMRWGTGKSYEAMGFELQCINQMGYGYVKPATGEYTVRQTFQKHKLLKMIEEGTMVAPPEGVKLQEGTITAANGWYPFFDAGQAVYVLRVDEVPV